jgi:hypothetical protein
MTVNHGLINKAYYKQKENTKNLFLEYPELEAFNKYFSNYTSRNRYYVAMKYHAIKQIKLMVPEITYQKVGEVMGGMHHATVLYYYSDKYTPLNNHDLFIKNNFNAYVESFIYPVTSKNYIGEFVGKHFPLKQIA